MKNEESAAAVHSERNNLDITKDRSCKAMTAQC